MATSWGLTGDDLAQWARKYDAPGLLPELVRRLILATAPVSAVTMSSHAGTRLPGWDGEVRASSQTPFCPAGRSFWELTVEDNKAKLTQDFRKRSALATREATYVAVSAGRVPGHMRWAQDRAAEGLWRDVRLIHADDLAAWLATAPAVARWFGRVIGLSRSDGTDVGSFLDSWRARTPIRLPLEIAIAGEQRQRHAESIRAWARTAGPASKPLRVYGDTWDEAAVFAAAALVLDPSLEGSQVLARTVVAETPDTLRSLGREQQAESTVAIAAFPGAISDLGPVILSLAGPAPEGGPAIELSPAPHLRFAEILANAGMPIDQADRYARQSGGKLSALQRLLGYVAPPTWATGAPQVPIAIMLLVGAFEPNNPDDREAIALLGGEPAEVELLCEQLRLSPDAPTVKEQGRSGRSVWRWRAPADAWKALVGRVPASVLRTLPSVATRILAERDPGFDLPKDQRFAAALYGKSLRASEHLRQGLARTLAHLAQSDEAFEILHGRHHGSMIAATVVHDVLPADWASWASVSRLLPLLAEAAPVPFMEALERSLLAPSSGAAALLQQEVATGASPHVGLLWALETLGWAEHLMPRVAAALAILAQRDVDGHLPGKLVNRPAHSLEKLLRLALWQTNAGPDARISELARRLREDPAATVGFHHDMRNATPPTAPRCGELGRGRQPSMGHRSHSRRAGAS